MVLNGVTWRRAYCIKPWRCVVARHSRRAACVVPIMTMMSVRGVSAIKLLNAA
jgi:hypothetical protein